MDPSDVEVGDDLGNHPEEDAVAQERPADEDDRVDGQQFPAGEGDTPEHRRSSGRGKDEEHDDRSHRRDAGGKGVDLAPGEFYVEGPDGYQDEQCECEHECSDGHVVTLFPECVLCLVATASA